jgi:hypothetical protein
MSFSCPQVLRLSGQQQTEGRRAHQESRTWGAGPRPPQPRPGPAPGPAPAVAPVRPVSRLPAVLRREPPGAPASHPAPSSAAQPCRGPGRSPPSCFSAESAPCAATRPPTAPTPTCWAPGSSRWAAAVPSATLTARFWVSRRLPRRAWGPRGPLGAAASSWPYISSLSGFSSCLQELFLFNFCALCWVFQKGVEHLYFIYLFIFGGTDWDLNSGRRLPLGPHLQSILLWLIWRWGSSEQRSSPSQPPK